MMTVTVSPFFDAFGPPMISGFSAALCYVAFRRDFPAASAVILAAGTLIVAPVMSRVAGEVLGVSASMFAFGFGLACAVTLDLLHKLKSKLTAQE